MRFGRCLGLLALGLMAHGCHRRHVAHEAGVYRDRFVWIDPEPSCSDSSPRWLPLTRATDTLLRTLPPAGPITSGPLGRGRRPLEREAWIARQVAGGWGGGPFVSSVGGAYILLRDPTQKLPALAALDTLRPADSWHDVPPHSVGVREARWDLAELYDWRVALEEGVALAGGARINGWGVDPEKNRVFLFVVDSASLAALPQWLQRVNAPCRLVAAQVIGELQMGGLVKPR